MSTLRGQEGRRKERMVNGKRARARRKEWSMVRGNRETTGQGQEGRGRRNERMANSMRARGRRKEIMINGKGATGRRKERMIKGKRQEGGGRKD